MNEIWKDAPGWEGLYQVSNWGRVKRLAGSPKCKRDRILKQQPDKDGYSHLTFSKNGILTNVKVHRLVISMVRRHSQKPDCIYDHIESLVDGPYLEVFARQTHKNRDCWGNEVESTIQLAI